MFGPCVAYFFCRVFFLQHASELVKTVATRYDEYVNVKDLSNKIARALTAGKKDNDFIYHDRVPEQKDLEQIGKAALVKPTAIQVPISQKFSGKTSKALTTSAGVLRVEVVEESESGHHHIGIHYL